MKHRPNWWPKLKEAARANGVALSRAVSVAEIRHDDGCARLLGMGVCNCDPDVHLTSKRIRGGEEA